VIFVDANVFLRHLVQPATPQDRVNRRRATALFQRVEQGREQITTSEATIAEVVFILSARTHYNSPRSTVVTGLRPLISPNGCKLPENAVCLRALELWVAYSRLSFPDALAAAYSEQLGHELATFDERLSRISGIVNHSFQEPPSNGAEETS
jgi:predicted nucleic acid-binding protein